MAAAHVVLTARRAPAAVLLAVLVLHGLALASLPRVAPAREASRRLAAVLVQVAPPAVAPSEVAPQARTAPAAARSRSMPARRAAVPPPRAETSPETGTAPAAPETAEAPAPLQLDTEATRRALRALGRAPRSAAELAAQDPRGPQRAAGTRLAAGMAGAALGDCMRGEYAGSGMGLLSLPMLALAEARGKCSSR